MHADDDGVKFAQEDFDDPFVKEYQQEWGVPDDYMEQLRDMYLGTPVDGKGCGSEEEMRKVGWKNRQQYWICACLRYY